jgi:crotonobetainyl-CoA:carnitine CoA-transferase CaiB-like acyl-CoA transferase
MASPLDGIRVIDLSRVLAGPQCASMLGDLGADVIKVESVTSGDETRSWAPYADGESTAFMSVNRNKRSMSVDLRQDEGRAIVRSLILDADVVIENFRTGTMERWDLSYEDLRGAAPRLIYAAISAYGRSGELANHPGYEAVLQAFSGIMSITGDPDGMPARSGPSLLDLGTGIVTAHAITAAVLDRERTGAGQLIETSLLGTAMTLLGYHAQGYLSAGEVPGRLGSGHGALVPYRAYPCAGDKAVFIAAGNQSLWVRFCDAMGFNDLRDDPRFVTLPDRRRHRGELDDILAARLSTLERDEILATLEQAGVPGAPVNDVSEVLDHPQVRELGAISSVDDPARQRSIDLVSSPFRASAMPTHVRRVPPEHGEHTTQILTELGYTEDAQRRLRDQGVVA